MDFPDVGDVSDWAVDAMTWANQNKIIDGDEQSDGQLLLLPKNTTTRAQAASIMRGFCESTKTDPTPDPDPQPVADGVTVPSVLQLGDQGYIMGYEENGIHAFKGIRYGTAQRFKRAAAVTSYGTATSPANCLTNGAVSPQGGTNSQSSKAFAAAAFMTPSDSDMFSIEANCLNLNVWTDKLDQNANKPVLVFFHGGTKVSALASSPKALKENLFQKVVISSGFGASARTPEYTAQQAETVASNVRHSDLFADWYRTNKKIGDDTTWSDIKAAAEKADNADVFAFLQQVRYDDLSSFGLSTGTFTADGEYFDTSGNLTANGLNETARNYTYLIGSAWAEMGGRNSADAVLGNWNNSGSPSEAVSNLSEETKKSRMESYLANRVGNYDETKKAFEEAYPNHDFYDLRSLQTTNFDNSRYKNMAGLVTEGNKVYNYFSGYTMPYFGGMTMIHTGDLAYFFHSIDTAPYQIAGDEKNAHKVADTMANVLASFCTNGDPSIKGLTWEAMTTDTAHTMILDVQSRCVTPDFNATLRGLLASK